VTGSSGRVPVTVVTGGAVGIGAAIAEDLGAHGVFVVTVDPGVAVDGRPQEGGGAELTTAQRIVDAGGQARASNISVTDAEAVRALFTGLVEEFGALDAVVNVAGISRPTGFASGDDDDWRAVLSVHLDGYLNVLTAALPLMTAAGHGRILGVTSGSGWRAADAGAYSCAKRAVAALTWRIGQTTPPGVTVNALSPIAATRMVLSALSRQAGAGNATGRDAATGGLSLGAVAPPRHHRPGGGDPAGGGG
jgi:NAD(P)-dependent dehydrogenase (short-subunit alcohol dehydrogenase family)